MGTLAHSNGPDEMQQYAEFHHSGTEKKHNLETFTCGSLNYTMVVPYLLETFNRIQGLNTKADVSIKDR